MTSGQATDTSTLTGRTVAPPAGRARRLLAGITALALAFALLPGLPALSEPAPMDPHARDRSCDVVVAEDGDLQAAIDAANEGGVICAGGGPYQGNPPIVVDKALTFRGANAGVNPNTETRGPESFINGGWLIQASGVTIDGFTIQGDGSAIASTAAGVSDVTIVNNIMTGNTGQQTVRYLGSAGSDARSGWTVSDNLIEDIRHADATAMWLQDMTDLAISSNVIRHTNTDFDGRRGLNIDGGQNVTIANNDIDLGAEVLPDLSTLAEVFDAARYSLQIASSNRPASDYLVTGNRFAGHYSGVITLGQGREIGPITIQGNTITNTVFGVRGQAGCALPPGEADHCKEGSSLVGLTIKNNDIDARWQAVRLQQGLGAGSTYEAVSLNNNRLLGGFFFGSALQVTGEALFNDPIDARLNVWGGGEEGPEFFAIETDEAEVEVQTFPWIATFEEGSPPEGFPEGRGFWPTEITTPPVNNVTSGEGYLTIQAAISEADANDVIEVAAGTYEEQVVINVEGLTLRGPSNGDPATIRGTARPQVLIEAGDVTVENIRVESASDGIDRGFGVTNASRVLLDGVSAEGFTTGLSLDFAGSAPSVVTVTRSTFVDNMAGIGSTDNVNGLDIVDNTFSNNEEGIGLRTGLQNAMITGNTFSGGQTFVRDYANVATGTNQTLAQIRDANTFLPGVVIDETGQALVPATSPPSPPSPPAPTLPEPDPEEPPTPVRGESGRLPEPGGAAGTVGGERTVLEVERTVTGGVSIAGEGFAIELAPDAVVDDDDAPDPGTPAPDEPEADDEDAPVRFARGRAVELRLQGFAPSSPVQVWLFSEPRLLGNFTTDAAGVLTAATEALSDEVSACPHTLQVTGQLPGGREAAVSLGVWVEAGELRFADTVGSPAARAVQCLADLDIVEGYADGSFGTNRVVTRQAMAAFLHRLAGEPVPAVLDWFEDVGGDHPFRVPIAWMAEVGLANGFDDGRFHPNREVTRQAVAAFLYRQSGQPQAALGAPFSDVGRAHPFSREIGWLAGEGITRGYTDGSFRPSEPVRRGPLARLLVRSFEPLGIEP